MVNKLVFVVLADGKRLDMLPDIVEDANKLDIKSESAVQILEPKITRLF